MGDAWTLFSLSTCQSFINGMACFAFYLTYYQGCTPEINRLLPDFSLKVGRQARPNTTGRKP